MLKITLASGQVQEVPFNQSSTLTIINQGFVDGVSTPVTASFSEISEIEVTADPVDAGPNIQTEDPPAPPVPTGSVPVDVSAPVTEPTSGTSNAFATAGNTSAGNDAQNPVVTSATPASGLDAIVTTDPPADTTAAADEPSQPPVPDTSNPQVASSAPAPSLPDVVASAGAVVDAAVSDPAAHIDHLAQAQTDVGMALQTWPDDANLLDLKQQLDDLAADASEASPGA